MKLKNPEVRIETIAQCNSRCIMCPRELLTRSKAPMPFNHFADLVDQSCELDAEIIGLFGFGEPLLDVEIDKKIEYVSFNGLSSHLTTNASLLSADMANRLLLADLDMIRFSVHGIGQTYNKTHQGLSWHRTLQNILNFVEINCGQCETHISVIPMWGETVEEIVEFWGGIVDHIEIWRPHNWTYGRHYRHTERRLKTCNRPFSGPVQINCDGSMMVCCFDFNAEMKVGNTWDAKISEILKGKEFNEIRNAHESGNLHNLPCNTCDQLNVYDESNHPLLYSSRDIKRKIGTTSSIKYNLMEN